MGKSNPSGSAAPAPSASRRSPGRARPPGASFTPVAVRARRDGWAPARQHEFIAALADEKHRHDREHV